jgi:hypothetical protein
MSIDSRRLRIVLLTVAGLIVSIGKMWLSLTKLTIACMQCEVWLYTTFSACDISPDSDLAISATSPDIDLSIFVTRQVE